MLTSAACSVSQAHAHTNSLSAALHLRLQKIPFPCLIAKYPWQITARWGSGSRRWLLTWEWCAEGRRAVVAGWISKIVWNEFLVLVYPAARVRRTFTLSVTVWARLPRWWGGLWMLLTASGILETEQGDTEINRNGRSSETGNGYWVMWTGVSSCLTRIPPGNIVRKFAFTL